MRLARALFAAFVSGLVGAAAPADPSRTGDLARTLEPEGPPRRLPAALVEISGLAPAGGTRVYAHTDEEASIYEIDVKTGAAVRAFTFGRPAAIGDFEAIAARGGVLSLVTSAGVVYEAEPDQGRRALAFRAIDTGVGRFCEIEGFAPSDAGYLLACKRKGKRLVVYEWSRENGASAPLIDMKLSGAVPNPKDFRATDLVADEKAGTLLVLDAAAGAILEVSRAGKARGYWRLGGDHPQAEGLALLPDGRLLVADEGRMGEGKIGAGKLTAYPRRR